MCNSYVVSSFRKYFENKVAIDFWSVSKNFFSTLFSSTSVYFSPWSSIIFVCFSRAFPKEESANLACSIICLWLEGNIFSPVRYSYFSIFLDDNAVIFAASLLISYYNFSSLILWSIVMISFYILSERFFLKCKGLFDARVTSITKKEYGFAAHFYIDSLSFESQYLIND